MRTLIALAALAATPAFAEAVDSKTARDMLFSTRGESIVFSDEIGEADRALLSQVIKLSAERMNQPLLYYATIAYSPDEGLASEALQSSANHHGVAAADRAALAACDARRKAGTRPCAVAARIVPRRYAPRDLELSLGATTAFGGEYRSIRGNKVLAISPATGAFSFAGGDTAADLAVTQCNRSSQGANDCKIVISD